MAGVSGEEERQDKSDGFVAREREHRLQKLDELRKRGIDPYPPHFDRDHTAAEIREKHADLEAGKETKDSVRVAGRAMHIRRHGGLIFADLRDETGQIQLLVSRSDVGEEAEKDFDHLDLGDWIGAEGTVMTTETGELSVRVKKFELLSPALRSVPRTLTDVDTRYRERYLDLIVNEETRRIFEIRSATIAAIRRELLDRGFREVETQMLDAHAGGAAARPFITHHNALDIDMYLRIALELPLKRLIVGGMGKVFEIGRVFRNEGLDTRHNPEFTLLEAYEAFADYHDMMDLVESLCSEAAKEAHGTTKIHVGEQEIDLAPPWRRATMAELIKEHAGIEMHPSMPVEDARKIAEQHDVPIEDEWGAGKIMAEVYDETCESKLVEPTFVMDHPREVSPLARAHRDDPTLTERFEAVIAGRELANAYSELNDPVDQAQRFDDEAKAKAAGDEEAEEPDDDYVRALEYGLPPTGGLGIGLDRLVMLIADASAIREVILFPTMRPEGGTIRDAGPAPGEAGAIPTADSLRAGDGKPAEPAKAPPGEPPESIPAPGAAPEPAPSAPPPAAPSGRVRALAWATAVLGIISLIPTIPAIHDDLGIEPLIDRNGRVISHVASVLIGAVLLLVARQLARRKRTAWQFAVGLFALGTIVHLFKGPDPIAVLLDAVMLVALVWWRRDFVAPTDPGSLLTLARFVPLYLLGVLAFGATALLVASDKIPQTLTVGGILETTFGGLVGIDGPYTYESKLFDEFFPAALVALGVLGAIVVVFLLFRPLVARRATGDDRERARELVHIYGSDTLAYFDLHDGKSYFFSSDGKAMVAYAYMGGYALASADPVGAPESIARVLDEFIAFCRDRGWHITFLAIREETARTYVDRGFHSIYLGDEAIIPCDTFTLNGGGMKAVRAAVGRVGKEHHFQLMRESDATPQLVEQLNAISEQWRGGEEERGFTMELARDVTGDEPDLLLAIALDRDNRPVGFLRLVPCFGDDPGYSLDLMRRKPDSVNGLTEYLIAKSALALGGQGFRRLSMNFAAWGRLFDESRGLRPGERIERRVAKALNPFFQIQSLRDFNLKFQPEWLPRSIALEDPADFPRVGVLYASVEGFLKLPLIGGLLVPSVPSSNGGVAATESAKADRA
jgi:lysyl-tRNA synthetase, class II